MPRLPRVKASEVISALERMGFVQMRQRGSHVILKKPLPIDEESDRQAGEVGCVVPLHRKTLAVGTRQLHPEPGWNFRRRIFDISLRNTNKPNYLGNNFGISAIALLSTHQITTTPLLFAFLWDLVAQVLVARASRLCP